VVRGARMCNSRRQRPLPMRLSLWKWLPPGGRPATEVEVQRPDGTRLRITYTDASPTLVPLLQTFLDFH
jgi:hypothetical protein